MDHVPILAVPMDHVPILPVPMDHVSAYLAVGTPYLPPQGVILPQNLWGLEGGGGLITAGESSDMLYSKASSSDAEEELISASASDSRDCKILFSNGGRTAIGKSSMSTEVGVVVGKGFNVD
ncbi:hypothetical protein AVEN_61803-1 [Araneus ventricosus]|uniref:Uncharacterized protein n=1 Tax=Araneus ventricosus TaxID=182803 RepID=A0A4Y2AQW7_ARAVE|nr:hypothetical protein AVEN_227048-1 [Araneus ventricosus]GBL81414.1 hypothetical protein AVEN_61803-1 [Araneus ventricosus]